MVSGAVNRNAPYRWTTWEEAHIFPPEKTSLWIESNFSRWITDMDHANEVSKISSLQNGLLLKSDIRQLFDQYLLSVDPDVSASLRFVVYAEW